MSAPAAATPRARVAVAYALWCLAGWFGIHNFYLGRRKVAAAQLAMFVAGLLTAFIGVGVAILAVLSVWLVMDLFLIPGAARGMHAAMTNSG